MKKLPLFLILVVFLSLVMGCSGVVIVGPEVPVMGDIRICTYNSYIYGYVYVDGLNTGYRIDGWGGPYCTGYIRVELDRTHTVEVRSPIDGLTYYDSFRPTFSGQRIDLP
ncbi:MAG: hypothetical protein ACUVQZ_04485 [Candidatus Caldatribacteriaceae bacterium]